MKNWLAGAMALVMTAALLAPAVSEARRLGGGSSTGMQRSMPARQTPQTPPAQPAAPQPAAPTPSPATAPAAAATTAAAAAPAKRSWLGPIAGLAAGLGLAALLSHFGLGAEFASLLVLALLAVLAIVVVRFLMARARGATTAGRLAPAGAVPAAWDSASRRAEPPFGAQAPLPAATPAGAEVSVTGQPLAPIGAAPAAADAAATATVARLPEGFDRAGFERVAKMIFIRLQAANDAADLDDLRQFTTPEMFAAARLEIQERGGKPQHTDVERVEAEVLDFAREDERQVVSVRFHGRVREDKDGAAEAFDEIWHLVKPADDSRPWAIAGIQQPH